MFDFLVTSTTRRRLLLVLWGAHERGSARELAEKVGLSTSNAYRELVSMHRHDLVTMQRQRGTVVYEANLSHPEADLLRRLTQTKSSPRAERPGDAGVRGRLRSLGAPLAAEPEPVGDLERTLVEGVEVAHRDPTVARTLPACFWLQRRKLDGKALEAAARELGEKHAVGFFMAVAGLLARDTKLKNLGYSFRDVRVRDRAFFDLPSKQRHDSTDAWMATLSREWGLKMNLDRGSFEKPLAMVREQS